MATIYIGNLAWSVDDASLTELCQNYNCTRANVVMGRNGRSRGYGLVQFATRELADDCINKLTGYEFEGREIHCKYDEGGNKKAGANNNENNASFTGKSLYVSNLPWATDDAKLEEIFAAYNPVSCAVKYSNDKRSRGWATVVFQNAEAAKSAMEAMNGFSIDDRAMAIRLDFRA